MSALLAAANSYADLSYSLIPLAGKRPVDSQWTDISKVHYTREAIACRIADGFNVGFRIPRGMLIVDVDPKNGGLASWNKLLDDVPELNWYPVTVDTAGGGFHLYLTIGDGVKVPTTSVAYPGIDFLQHGRQVVIVGSVGANGKLYKWATGAILAGQACPEPLVDILSRVGEGVSALNHADAAAKEKYYADHGWNVIDAKELATILLYLAPEQYRDQGIWFSLMASCHFATGGDTVALDTFIAWSTQDALYADASDKIESRWASLSKEGSTVAGQPITTATLLREMKQVGCGDSIKWLRARMGNTQREALREAVAFDNVGGGVGGEPGGSITIGKDGVVTVSTAVSGSDKTSPEQTLQRWLDKLGMLNGDAGAISTTFMSELSEAPDLLPAQIDIILAAVKEKTNLGLGVLRDDLRVRSSGVMGFLADARDTKDVVTQVNVVMGVKERLGGKGLAMFNMGTMWRWQGSGKWEPMDSTELRAMVMTTMGDMSFAPVTAGSISSVSTMLELNLNRSGDVWEGAGRGLSDAALSVAKFDVQRAPMINMLDGEFHLVAGAGAGAGAGAEGGWKVKRHCAESFKRNVLPVRTNPGNIGWEGIGEPVEWMKFLNTALWCSSEKESELRKRQLAVFIGYSMIESMPWLKKAVYLYGPPDSGKSVVMDVVSELLGGATTCSTLSISHMGSQFAPSMLVGKLANFAGEIGVGELIADAQFKMIISGDNMMVEKKGQDGFTMANKAVFWFAGNNLPRSRDRSSGIESRLLYIPFEWTVKPENRDYSLRSKLMSELDNIAKWALDIFADEWSKDQCNSIVNTPSEGQARVLAEWKDESEPARVWFADNLIATGDEVLCENGDLRQGLRSQLSDGFLSNKALYTNYKKWCTESGHRPLTSNHLSRSLIGIVSELASAQPEDVRSQFTSHVHKGKRGNVRGWYGLYFQAGDMFT